MANGWDRSIWLYPAVKKEERQSKLCKMATKLSVHCTVNVQHAAQYALHVCSPQLAAEGLRSIRPSDTGPIHEPFLPDSYSCLHNTP
jgi:hypothetical protein